tara:strand:+ start:731 stop:970 length:240 start_codon:yes stop_codon:yes gene_type:complete
MARPKKASTKKKSTSTRKKVTIPKKEPMMMDMLKGKKTYITALVIGVIAAAESLGYVIPEFVYPMLGALGLGTLRHGMK